MTSSDQRTRAPSQALWWVLWLLTLAAIGWIWWTVDGRYLGLNSRVDTVTAAVSQVRLGAADAGRKADEVASRFGPSTQRLQQQVTEVETQATNAQRQAADALSRLAQFQTQTAQLASQVAPVQAQAAEASAQVARALTQAADAAGQAARTQSQAVEARELASRADARTSELQAKVDQTQTQIADAVARLGDLQARPDAAKDVEARIAATQASAADLRQQLDRRTSELAVELEQIRRAMQATDAVRLRQELEQADQQIVRIRVALAAAAPAAEAIERLREMADSLRTAETRAAAGREETARTLAALTQEVERLKTGASGNTVAARALERSEQVERDLAQLRASLAAAAPRADVTQILGELDAKLRGTATTEQVNRSVAALSSEFERIKRLAEAARSGQASSCEAEGAYPLSVYFGPNSAKIDDDTRATLISFVRSLESPTAQGCRLLIYGYADRQGGSSANQSLSLRRAVSVRNQLVDSGLDENRIVTVSGLGAEAAPRESSREQDRRVMISIVR